MHYSKGDYRNKAISDYKRKVGLDLVTAPDLVSNSRVKLGYVLPSSANNPSAVAKQPQTVPAGTLAPRLITAAQIVVTEGEANRT